MLNFSLRNIGGGSMILRSFQVESNTRVIFYLRNITSSAVTDATLAARAYYMRITS